MLNTYVGQAFFTAVTDYITDTGVRHDSKSCWWLCKSEGISVGIPESCPGSLGFSQGHLESSQDSKSCK